MDEFDDLETRMSRLRAEGKPLESLTEFLRYSEPNPNKEQLVLRRAFRQHFLGGNSGKETFACLLMEAGAKEAAKEFRPLLLQLTQTNDRHQARLRQFLNTPRLEHLLAAQLAILEAVTNSGTDTAIQEKLLDAVRLYSLASPLDHEAERVRREEIAKLAPERRPQPAFLTRLDGAWEQQLKDVESAWRREHSPDAHPNWDAPALLLVGETLAYLLDPGDLPRVGVPIQTWVLLASAYEQQRGEELVEIPDGLLARLVIEKVPGGSGLLYPDCRYSGYLPLNKEFQLGLRNVMRVMRRRLDWIENAGMTYDYRWRLIPLSPDDGHQQPVLLGAIDGRSAELAFASAIRAALLNERLDPHVAITARFAEPGASHERLFHVEGVSLKVLGLRQGEEPLGASVGLKGHRIDQIVLASDDPFAKVGDTVRVHLWPMQIATAKTFDDAYRRLSDHCRLTNQYHDAVIWSARQWFQKECFGSGDETDPTGAYRLNDFQLRAMNPAADEKSVPFDGERLGQLIRGDVRDALSFDGRPAWRANIVADSGMGKTSLLVYIAHQTASEHGVRIPIRVEQLSTFLSVPQRDSFLEAAVAEVHSLFTDYQQHVSPESKVPTRESLFAWLDVATKRGEVVWLLDALDQMSEHQSHLKRFADEFDECAVLLTMRQEALSSSPLRDRGQTLDLQPFTTATAMAYLGEYANLFFKRLPISDRGEPEDRHVLTIPLLLHLLRELAIDLNLDPSATQIDHTALRNRYRIYDLALIHEGGLVDKGCRSLALRKDLRGPRLDDKLHAIECLQTMAWEQMQAGHVDTLVVGSLYKKLAGSLREIAASRDTVDAFKQINVVTQLPAFDQHPLGGLKWRHRSFLEFFAGCQLAELPLEELKRQIDDHARDDKWSWCLRFAVSKIQDDAPEMLDEVAQYLLEAGAPFLLWMMVDQDGITVSKPVDDLCRWLVHRDQDSWKESSEPATSPWAGRSEDQRPAVTGKTAATLSKMFGVGVDEPWKRRDSRWLHPAWQLVVENLPESSTAFAAGSSDRLPSVPAASAVPLTECQQICQAIHTQFLGEFEQRVRTAAARNQRSLPQDWQAEDKGLLQLVPDETLCDLGVITADQLAAIRNWPPQPSTPLPNAATSTPAMYLEQRSKFNQQLKFHMANFCACPPTGWEHPRSNRLNCLPERYELQRVPMTNRQYLAFDPRHHRNRFASWKQSNTGTSDDQPVTLVSWFQACVLCEWMTGNGRFGSFRLPLSGEWKSCRFYGLLQSTTVYEWMRDRIDPLFEDSKEIFVNVDSVFRVSDGISDELTPEQDSRFRGTLFAARQHPNLGVRVSLTRYS